MGQNFSSRDDQNPLNQKPLSDQEFKSYQKRYQENKVAEWEFNAREKRRLGQQAADQKMYDERIRFLYRFKVIKGLNKDELKWEFQKGTKVEVKMGNKWVAGEVLGPEVNDPEAGNLVSVSIPGSTVTVKQLDDNHIRIPWEMKKLFRIGTLVKVKTEQGAWFDGFVVGPEESDDRAGTFVFVKLNIAPIKYLNIRIPNEKRIRIVSDSDEHREQWLIKNRPDLLDEGHPKYQRRKRRRRPSRSDRNPPSKVPKRSNSPPFKLP